MGLVPMKEGRWFAVNHPILRRSHGSEQGRVRLKGRGRRAAAAASAVAG